MKQIIQSPRTGKLELLDVPAPTPAPGQVLVRNHFSVVSPGTEKMVMGFARKSLVGKARSRPDLVKQVLRKLSQEGPLPTYRTVMGRLDVPQPLGYSSAGVVEAAGDGVFGITPGDRVACAGAGYANHAELVVVPENLVARVPDGVALEHAAFATIGSIALQGLRVAQPVLGEIVAVIGLGLIGQLSVQLLRANGCRVLGIDIDRDRVRQALAQGAEWGFAPDEIGQSWKDAATDGHGVDFALVTAAAETSAPIQLAAELCRAKGRVAVVGQTAMDLDRRSFYEKELELRMSMSYGPGRYDRRYEELGLDYPISYVRWTENRNIQAFLALLASGALRPESIDVQTLPFSQAEAAYEDLAAGRRRSLAVVFRYETDAPVTRTIPLAPAPERRPRETVGVAFIGAGNYAKNVLLPALRKAEGAQRLALVTATGPSARRTAEKFDFATCGTDAETVLSDKNVDIVFIATRHDTHAPLAIRALHAGKAVWLEKPLAIRAAHIEEIAGTVREAAGFLAVGYNRRFSPHARAVKAAFARREGPLTIHYTVAAGPAPAGTWHLDPNEGGGRILGEACHFVDLCTYLVGAPPASVFARPVGRAPSDDSMISILDFPDGSTAIIEYLASTGPELPKERFEASADGRTARCENFRATKISGAKDVRTMNQDKGQVAAVREVIAAVRAGNPSPFSLEELVGVSRATFAILESARVGKLVSLA